MFNDDGFTEDEMDLLYKVITDFLLNMPEDKPYPKRDIDMAINIRRKLKELLYG